MPSTTLSVSILNSTLTSDPLFGRTCLLICHDDTRRDLRHPAKIYSQECVEGEYSELRPYGVLRSSLRGDLSPPLRQAIYLGPYPSVPWSCAPPSRGQM